MNSTFHPHKLLPSEADKLEGRYDLLTFEEFTPGSEIVVCKECKTIQLFEDTWCADQDNPCCIKCRCNETVRFDLSIFTGNTHVSINHQGKSKKGKIKIGSTSNNHGLINRILQAIRNFNLLDKVLDISQAIAIFRCIGIIFIVIAVIATFVLNSQSKIHFEKVSSYYTTTELSVKEVNIKIISGSSNVNKKLADSNTELVGSSSNINKKLTDSSIELINASSNINRQIVLWIKSVFDWFGNK